MTSKGRKKQEKMHLLVIHIMMEKNMGYHSLKKIQYWVKHLQTIEPSIIF